ncbi:hypothetical protein [Neorhizobium sp. T25_13]|uniref:hypothetical protein n=1 Tax=Neorhizobium sp. T25_13 TaxID=2093830 RepID=UPI000CFA6178|nr:hypothetical protein [Neorhizobium sp. T25_13]
MTFSEDSRQKLKSVSTATLTSVLLKDGLRNVFIRNVHKINKGAPRLVGPGAFEQTVFEDFVGERVRAGEGIFGLYPPEAKAEQAFREWRREKGR